MATYSKLKLSGSTDGQPIKVTQTAIATGDTIHTAHATATDYVTLYAYNGDTAAIELSIGHGGTTDIDQVSKVTVGPKAGWVKVAEDFPLTNSLVIKAAAGTGNKIAITGSVKRVTP